METSGVVLKRVPGVANFSSHLFPEPQVFIHTVGFKKEKADMVIANV